MVQLNKQFDISGPTGGFHITGHLLALVGLIVACFAITGYITFRNNSVPYKALDLNDYDIEADKLDRSFPRKVVSSPVVLSLAQDSVTDELVATLPANSFINKIRIYVTDNPTQAAAAAGQIGTAIGVLKGGGDISAYAADAIPGDAAAPTRVEPDLLEPGLYSKSERQIWARFKVNGGALSKSGTYHVEVAYSILK